MKTIVFSISTPSYWTKIDVDETINKLREILQLSSKNDIELPVKKVEKRGIRIENENS